jgi:hypothetical protein
MSYEKVVTKTINGVKVDIYVNADGFFTTTVAGQSVRAETLRETVAQVKAATKRVAKKVSLPISILGQQLIKPLHQRPRWIRGNGVRHVTVYGIHTARNTPLAIDDLTGDRVEIEYRFDNTLTRRLTAEECETYTRLAEARWVAQNAFHNFERGVKIDVEEAVRKLQAEAEDTPDERVEEAAEDLDPR